MWASPPPPPVPLCPFIWRGSTEGSPPHSVSSPFSPPGLDSAPGPPAPLPCCPPPPPPGPGSLLWGSERHGFPPPPTPQPTLGRFMVVLLARLQGEALTRAAAWQHTAKAAMGRRGSLQGPSVCSNPIGGRTMGVCEDITQGLEHTPPSQGLSAASHQARLLQPKLAQAGAVAWVSASMATLGLVLGPTPAPLRDQTARPP